MFCFVLTNLFLIVTISNIASPGTEQEEKLVTLSLQKGIKYALKIYYARKNTTIA